MQDSNTSLKIIGDIFHSCGWLMFDAMWMIGHPELATYLILPTLIIGLGLVLLERCVAGIIMALSINCWFLMNTCWYLQEVFSIEAMGVGKVLFLIGVSGVITSIIISKDLQVVASHFKRFRYSPSKASAKIKEN